MGCKIAVSPQLPSRNGTINCLTYEEYVRQTNKDILCLFHVLALHLCGTQRLEERTSKLFNFFVNKKDGLSANQFQGVHMNDVPIVENLLSLNILLYVIDNVDANIIGETVR